jgi:hypothetical protein
MINDMTNNTPSSYATLHEATTQAASEVGSLRVDLAPLAINGQQPLL